MALAIEREKQVHINSTAPIIIPSDREREQRMMFSPEITATTAASPTTFIVSSHYTGSQPVGLTTICGGWNYIASRVVVCAKLFI